MFKGHQFNKEDYKQIPLGKIINSNSLIIEAFEQLRERMSWKDNTVKAYSKDLEKLLYFLNEIGINPTLENVNFETMKKWKEEMSINNLYSASTIKRMIDSLKSLFNVFVNAGIIEGNPFKHIRVNLDPSSSHSRSLNVIELGKVLSQALKLDSMEKRDTLAIVLTQMLTGLRCTNMINLKVNDIDFQRGQLRRIVRTVNAKHVVNTIPLPPFLLSVLNFHIQNRNISGNDPLFYNEHNNPLGEKNINSIVNKICIQLGWNLNDSFTPHGFRYSISTHFQLSLNDESTLAFLLGHNESKSVTKRYVKDTQFKQEILKSWIFTYEKDILSQVIASINDVESIENHSNQIWVHKLKLYLKDMVYFLNKFSYIEYRRHSISSIFHNAFPGSKPDYYAKSNIIRNNLDFNNAVNYPNTNEQMVSGHFGQSYQPNPYNNRFDFSRDFNRNQNYITHESEGYLKQENMDNMNLNNNYINNEWNFQTLNSVPLQDSNVLNEYEFPSKGVSTERNNTINKYGL
ncbi:tyrosine-type recombinase/integrase [Gottfriedia solisilvae]|uniref:Uncharacterized protein n=1 Tax=Gottfriedia solisilvae TaxID=1516104 RepID=A0A8J3EXS7_9BACI|nr:tyrosine-type recombinase/integrase [Gottfriedia solisilvae]GGI12571.1 hypothetical protein GCM10007380_13580 [Gottfriedia solisilvae]